MTTLHIVGHDGTERGDDAVALAARLARLLAAQLLAVHVMPMPPVHQRFGGILESLEQRGAAILARARERIGDTAPAGHVVFAKSPAAGLQQVCLDEGAGLVTIGSTHRGLVGSVLAGTTAERLLNGAPSPVALAPLGYATVEEDVATVIAGYDGSEEARSALDLAADLAGRLDVGLRVVAVAEPPSPLADPGLGLTLELQQAMRDDAERTLSEGLERVPPGLRCEGSLASGGPGPALVTAARGPGNLLVVGSRGYGPLRSVLVGAVGHFLARNASCPVVVVPRGADTGHVGEVHGKATVSA